MTYLRMSGITRTFPGVIANDNIDFNVERGEIHALVGENGAGKSTLMHILYGIMRPDAGQIFLDEAFAHEKAVQTEIVSKVRRIEPAIRASLILTVIITLAVVGYYAWEASRRLGFLG